MVTLVEQLTPPPPPRRIQWADAGREHWYYLRAGHKENRLDRRTRTVESTTDQDSISALRRQLRADREFHSQGDIATITAAGPRRCDTHPVALPSHQIPSQRPGAQI